MIFWHPKKCIFGYRRKPPQKNIFVFWLWFSFKNNRHANVLLVSIFENAPKSYWSSKTPFWPFLAVNNVFLCVFKNTVQITSVRLLFLKLKQKKNFKKNFFVQFLFQNSKMLFLGVAQFFSNFFLSVLAFKTIDIPTSMPNLVKKY